MTTDAMPNNALSERNVIERSTRTERKARGRRQHDQKRDPRFCQFRVGSDTFAKRQGEAIDYLDCRST